MDEEFVGAVALGLVLVYNLAPQQAGGADLGHLHEVGAADAHVEDHGTAHVLHLAAEVGEAGHKLVGGGQAEAEFLHDVRTGVVKQATVDGQHAELGQRLVGVFHQFFGHQEVAFLAMEELAVFQRMTEGVELARAAEFLGVVALLLGVFDIELQQLQVVLRAHEVDAHGVDIDAFEQGGHVVEGLDAFGAEPNRGGAALHSVEGHAVGLHGVGNADVLPHVPHVVVGVFATGVGHLAGVAVQILQTLKVFGTVVGFHLEPLDGTPHEFLLVVGSFEVLVDDFFPFLGRNGREFAEQFVVFHYIVSFICFYCKMQIYIFFFNRAKKLSF